jgi:hypothetical protein
MVARRHAEPTPEGTRERRMVAESAGERDVADRIAMEKEPQRGVLEAKAQRVLLRRFADVPPELALEVEGR